jgi:CBS domain-containing protein
MAISELTAAEVMTVDAITVAEHESLAAAWEILARAGCQFLPVLRGRRVVGVIDDHAVIVARSTRWLDGRLRLVGDVAGPSRVVAADTLLPQLLEQLSDHGGSALVVVDDRGAVLGLVTAERIVDLVERALNASGV